MFEFSEVKASVAVANGTNMTAIQGRAVVCRCKKNVLIDNDDNRVMLEKGDIVVCTNTGDMGEIKLAHESHMKVISSEKLINSPDGWWRYKSLCTLDEFRNSFEILNDETDLVEGHLNAAKEKAKGLNNIEERIKDIEYKYDEKADNRTVAVALISVFGCIAAIICGFIIGKTDMIVIAFIVLFVFVCFWIPLLCGNYLLPFFQVRNKSELDKAQKEYDEQFNTDVAVLNKLRASDGWYTGA